MRTALFVLLAACGPSRATPPAPPPSPPPHQFKPRPVDPGGPIVGSLGPSKPVTSSTLAAIGLDPAAIDRNADPCEDFYQFSCGNWIAKTEIPADKPLAMRSFVAIEDRNQEYLHDVLEKMRTNAGADPLAKQLGAFYGACMDEAAIAKAGIKPVAPLLAAIKKVKDGKTLTAALATLHTHGIKALFALDPTEDFADATKVIASLDQAGLGLPDRDYYLVDNDQHKALRTAYEAYATALLVESGLKAEAAKKAATEILALETEIAKVSLDKVKRRDPKVVYNKIDRDGVAKLASHVDWNAFWKAVGLDKVKDVTVSSKEFFAGVDALVVKTKPEVWRNYLTVHALDATAPLLTKKLEDERFKLAQAMIGLKEQEPRWKRCINHTDRAIGDSLGQVFVRDRFAGASKTAAEQQIAAINDEMKRNIDALPWMDATTKTKAHEKRTAVAFQIGYPNKWRSYSFKIDAKTFAVNALVARRAETARLLGKIGKPVDRDDWLMTAPTVNAYYNPLQNQMVFPAGILQPPFYSVDFAIPVNLGGMGMVVGHELTHGFDDQGAQFDAKGNMTNWWQPDTEKAFKQRTQCVIDQYSGYGLNGANTVGENIADIGGVKLALAAYRALRSSAPETVIADGFTEDQQFFLAFGQVWCAKMRPEYEQMLITVDPHSPAKWRVNGTVSATPDFAKAFRCKAGAKMRPTKQCVVW